MNYREEIRKAIECPQFGNEKYGKWGALNLEQRKDIKRLLDELDTTDKLCKLFTLKIKELKEQQKEFIKYLEDEINNCTKQNDIFFVGMQNDIFFVGIQRAFKLSLQKYKEIIEDD